jgi:hypothetical protein
MREVTRDFAFGLSRASYCKQREANRTNSVPSSLEKWPSRAESISIRKFLPRIRSSAYKQIQIVATWKFWTSSILITTRLFKSNATYPHKHLTKLMWQCLIAIWYIYIYIYILTIADPRAIRPYHVSFVGYLCGMKHYSKLNYCLTLIMALHIEHKLSSLQPWNTRGFIYENLMKTYMTRWNMFATKKI